MVVVTENRRILFTEAGRERHLVCYYTVWYDTLHTLHFDKVSLYDRSRQTFVCTLHTEYTQLQTGIWKGSLSRNFNITTL